MLVKILSPLSYQTYPLVVGMVEIEDELLTQIGKNKCFDVESQKVIDYSPDNTKTNAIKEILEIKTKLKAWDGKTSKYADGEYSEKEWAEIVEQRKKWRARINELEALYEIQTSWE